MPQIKQKGYFGWKEPMKVTAATITTGWLAGMCFEMAAGAGDPYSANEADLCDTAGELVVGIAMESSADHASIYSGMNIPSASKVTLLHGHSKFEINHKAEVAAGTITAAYIAYSKTAVEAASVNDILYTDANGKLTNVSGSSLAHEQVYRVGYITQVPTATNYFTLGLVLFG